MTADNVKHTPGPWEIVENTGWDEAWCDWHRVGPINLAGGKADQNSRLISAAPDLLAVAQKVVNNWGDLHHKDLMQLRAAIAKAEGRS